ncbi:MAG: multidrug efflux RND transporter permease subunit [Planctomycetota bacterium]
MISRFFIDRPIFASVISIMITLAGGIAVFSLPIAQYPSITPPTVQVSCLYPGADAQVIADTVAAPIEQQVNGVENMLYMSSQSSNVGFYQLTVTFALGTDLDEAMVLVQNRVALAMPQLPEIVQLQGVDVKKKSVNMLLAINLISPDGRYDDIYMSNYASIHLQDELARVEGVGDIVYLGERNYSMRIWLDPDKMAQREITTQEVVSAVQAQNAQVAAGQVGQPPSQREGWIQLSVAALGRLTTPAEFADIIVKSVPNSDEDVAPALVRLGDVARVELAAESYSQQCMLDGQLSVGMGVYQRPGANAIATGRRIRQTMQELSTRFPDGLEYRIVFDTTPFIAESIRQVVGGMRDAIILVSIVVLLFLQNWRAALVPLIAVPVAIIGTFAVMSAIGFSLNTLSLFGLVLAIGIVVDDAIVVVENVQRLLEEGHSPKEATRAAMAEVTGPIVAVALVLTAVFIPCAFIAGITGEFFRQFAITIAVSMVISTFNSLTLSPALAAILLRPSDHKKDWFTRLIDFLFGWLFRLFNRFFAFGTHGYIRSVGGILRFSVIALAVYLGLLFATYWSFQHAPAGFIPLQDKGWLLVNVELPDSASVQRTQQVMVDVANVAAATPGVAHTITVAGESFLANASSSNYGSMFIILDPFEDRRSFKLNGLVMFLHLRQKYSETIRDAEVSVFPPPPVNGLGATGGFKLMLEDRRNQGPQALQAEADRLVRLASKSSKLAGVMTLYRSQTPQLFVDIDRSKVRAMGVSLSEVSQTLQVYLGSTYVNNFNDFGRTWHVNLQADQPYRNRVADIGRLQVRNDRGEMVPLSSLVRVRDATGPAIVTRYNMYNAADVHGRTQLGVSSGEALQVMNQAREQLGPGAMESEWTSLSYMQIKAGNTAIYVFALAVVFVFLVLAALYESWSIPLAIILVVPLGLLFSVLGVWAFPFMSVGIFTQIGFVVLVGLASKNAILVVQYAEQLRLEGTPLREATLEACRLRLRPIVMTSCAFILGVVPLIIQSGAGAEMRRSLGVAVFCGMIGVTIFGVLLTPAFYYVIRQLAAPTEHLHHLVRGLCSLLFGITLGGLLGDCLHRVTPWPRIPCVAGGVAAGILIFLVMGLRRTLAKRRREQETNASA